jgi:hypothetical protein
VFDTATRASLQKRSKPSSGCVNCCLLLWMNS